LCHKPLRAPAHGLLVRLRWQTSLKRAPARQVARDRLVMRADLAQHHLYFWRDPPADTVCAQDATLQVPSVRACRPLARAVARGSVQSFRLLPSASCCLHRIAGFHRLGTRLGTAPPRRRLPGMRRRSRARLAASQLHCHTRLSSGI